MQTDELIAQRQTLWQDLVTIIGPDMAKRFTTQQLNNLVHAGFLNKEDLLHASRESLSACLEPNKLLVDVLLEQKVSGATATAAAGAASGGGSIEDSTRQRNAIARRAGRVHAVAPTAAVSNDNCVGSCVVLNASGHVITNEHVIRAVNEREQLVVVLPELNLKFTADVQKQDAQLDLALVKPSVPRHIDDMTPLRFEYGCPPGMTVYCASFPAVVEEEIKMPETGTLNPQPTISRGHVICASAAERVSDYTAYPNSSGAGVFTDTLSLAGIHTGQISPHADINIPMTQRKQFTAALNEQLKLKSESPVFVPAELVATFVHGVGPELVAARVAGAGQAEAAKRRRSESSRSRLARWAMSLPVVSNLFQS